MIDAAPRRSGLHRAYVATVFVLGLAALVDALAALQREPAPYYWVALAAAAVAAQFWRIQVPGVKAHLSASEILLFMIVVLFGNAPAVITIAVDGLLFAFSREWLKRRKKQYLQAAFGLGEPVLSMWVASHVYFLLPGVVPLFASEASLQSVALPALAMGAAYFAMNSGLNAIVLSTSQGRSPYRHWLDKYKNLAGIFVSSAVIAVVVSLSLASPSPKELALVALVISPLVFAVYQFNQLETDRQHAGEEIKQMNVSLAETLAMMAEEADEATSLGHIRSVKKYSMWLADEIGLTDPEQLEALGFAALLHDLGKARIPEYIWKKPVALTDAEQQMMRTHAAIGAQLAGRIAVRFRQAVAPIIRHHHENWDGSGYPDRIGGSAIPLGSRIVQVADCYDALRRWRPYRRAWTHEEAMAIVRERAGTMYDPAIVAAFESLEPAVRSEAYESADASAPGDAASGAPAAPAGGGRDALMPDALRAAGRTALTHFLQHFSRVNTSAGVEDTCEIVSGYIRRLAPAGLVVFYLRDASSNDLVATHASGYGADLVRGTRMPLGEHVSGWVAVNAKSILNADPVLDGLDGLDQVEPGFKSLLSVPLKRDGDPVGVVTLYATHAQAFKDEQRLALEMASGAMAEALESAARNDAGAGAPAPLVPAFGPATCTDLEELLALDRRTGGIGGRARAVLCLKNDGHPGVMLHAAMAVSASTRITDLLFRTTDQTLVVLMTGADEATEHLVVQRIAAALPADIVPPPAEGSPLHLGFASGPRDGDTWSTLLSVAQHRAWRTAPAAAVPAPAGHPPQRQGGLPWKA